MNDLWVLFVFCFRFACFRFALVAAAVKTRAWYASAATDERWKYSVEA
jgi:hypothetical protein